MRFQLISLAVLTSAGIALVRFLASVRVNMIRELRLHAEAQLAEIAFELLYASMSIPMHFQTPRSSVTFAAVFTLVGLDT